MKKTTRFEGGRLNVYSADGQSILGELIDATWSDEVDSDVTNHVLAGVASDGTYEEFVRLNAEGVSNVTFQFEANGDRFAGKATLLLPSTDRKPGGNVIRIETLAEPAKA